MSLVIIALIALGISEFVIVNNQFTEINENFNMIQASFGRIQEFQRVAYDIRNIIFVQEDIITDPTSYSPSGDFI